MENQSENLFKLLERLSNIKAAPQVWDTNHHDQTNG